MYPINVKLGDDHAFVVKVLGKDTLQDLRRKLYSKDERVLPAKLFVIKFDQTCVELLDETVKVVDILYT